MIFFISFVSLYNIFIIILPFIPLEFKNLNPASKIVMFGCFIISLIFIALYTINEAIFKLSYGLISDRIYDYRICNHNSTLDNKYTIASDLLNGTLLNNICLDDFGTLYYLRFNIVSYRNILYLIAGACGLVSICYTFLRTWRFLEVQQIDFNKNKN